jgi:hypothetical protein
MVSVDNDIVGVFFNGKRIAERIEHGNCPILDEFRFDVPPELVKPGEENLVAFHLLDRPPDPGQANESFFDARILADIPTNQLDDIVDNLDEILEEQVPDVPIQALSIDPCPPPDPNGETHVRARFIVEGTGANGEIMITQRANRIVTEHMIDGNIMSTATQTPQRSLVTVNPDTTPPQRALTRVDITNLTAFPTVLQRSPVIVGLVECIAANDHIVRPEAPCQENVSIAEEACIKMCDQQVAAAYAMCGGSSSAGCVWDKIAAIQKAQNCIPECMKAAKTLREACPP